MSNATHDSRNPGDPKKRRRSRGGQNRRNNQNQGERQGDRGQDGRGQRQNRRQGQGRQPQGRQDTRPARKYSPPKLSWWQKLLKAIGLYKEPERPARPEAAGESPRFETGEARPVKSNTRNARTADAEGVERKPERSRERDDNRETGERRERRERGGDRRRAGGDPGSVESSRVYVGNLSYDVSESDLQELFKGIGGVRNVEIVYNRATHRSKGYGFVEMLHVDEAKQAVEVLHDQHFMGRKLNVSGAKSRGHDEREDQDEPERSDRSSRAVLAPIRPKETAGDSVAAASPGDAAPAAEPAPADASTEAAVETVTAPAAEPEAPVVEAAEVPVEGAPAASEAPESPAGEERRND
jgi:hypothetical protein